MMEAEVTPVTLSFWRIFTGCGKVLTANLMRLADSGRRTQAMKSVGVRKGRVVGGESEVGVAVPESGVRG